jgi:NRPS condensation-like uncharacterized protein
MSQWYKLDNSAKFFAAVSNRKNTSVYRVSALLTEKIDGSILQQAADHIYCRFPMLFVHLRSGIFWNYMDENESGLRVREDTSYPCAEINHFENDGYLLRILYSHKRVSVECFHTLTDGYGAIEFMKSLIYYYLRFSGKEIDHEDKIITAGEGASRGETEDSYQRHYRHYKKKSSKTKFRRNAYVVKGTNFPLYGNNVTTGIVSAKALNALAKSNGSTITAYLSAVLASALLKSRPNNREDDKPVVITVPVNLRKIFPSDTLRNFACVVDLVIEQKNAVFSDIVAEMSNQLREKTTKANLQAIVERNVAFERNIFLRFIPLVLKNFLIALNFELYGDPEKTTTLTNLGNIVIPSGMQNYIKWFEVNIYTSRKKPIKGAVLSVNDKLAISFSRTITEPEVIRHFFTFLANEGKLDVSVYSNNWGVVK